MGVQVGDERGVTVAVAGTLVGRAAIAVSVALTPDWIVLLMPCAVAVSAGVSGVAVSVGARVRGIGVASLVAGSAVGELVGGCAAIVALKSAIIVARSARSVAARSVVGDGSVVAIMVKVGSTTPLLSRAVVTVGVFPVSLLNPN